MKPTPPTVAVQLDSTPQGADAQTSTGQSCKTPCTVSVTTSESFTVSFTLPKYEPLTVPAHVTYEGGSLITQGTVTVDPNPIVGELKPMAPPPKPVRKRVRKPRPKAAAAPAAAAPAAAPAASGSPFPPAAAPAR